MLDIRSTNKGLLIPRLTTAERTSLGTTLAVTPDPLEAGMQVFDTTLNAYFTWNGSAWIVGLADDAVTSAKIIDGSVSNTDLAFGVGGIYKSSGTTPTGPVVFSIPTNGTLAVKPSCTQVANQFSVDGSTFSVDALSNRVGIGTTVPAKTLDVNGPSVF